MNDKIADRIIQCIERDIRGRLEGMVSVDLVELAAILDNEDDDLCRGIRRVLEGFLD